MLKNNFQFDKEALNKFLIENGCIRLPKIELCDQFAFVNGFYRSSKNQIKIFLRSLTPKRFGLFLRQAMSPKARRPELKREFFAKVLAHEIGHCLDEKMSPQFAKRYWLEIVLLAFLSTIVFSGFLKFARASFWLAIFSFLPFLYLFYKLHPAEIRARRFSQVYWREILSFFNS
jgi:hypothetical protein